MPVKIDRFTFSDKTIENFDRVGITPEKIEGWISEGRSNDISDEGIKSFITDQFHELNAENERGRNIGGALRYVVSKTPFVGDWADEIEASVRAGSTSGEEYNKYLQNARESQEGAERAFKENASSGNWFDRNMGKFAPEALNVAENIGVTALTGGANLMPGVSALQGGIEGLGAGEGTSNRLIKGGVGAGVGYTIPAVLNKLLPTKSVAERTISKYADKSLVNKGNTITTTLAKSLKTGDEPISVIAKESTRGTRPAIMKGLQQGLKGNDAQAQVLYDSALRNVDYEGGFIQYMKDRMPDNISKSLKNRLGKGFDALKGSFDATTADGDIIMNENLPNMIDNVINNIARSAKPAEKQAIKTAATKAFADRSVAKEITKKVIPQNMIGQLGNQASMIAPWRVVTNPTSQWKNLGTLNTMTGQSLLNRGLGGGLGDTGRSATDAILKNLLK